MDHAARHRGPLLVHAGSSRSDLAEGRAVLPDMPPAEGLVFGAIVGVVTLVDVVPLAEVSADPFAVGPWCWLLRDPRRLREPIACPGSLPLWTPSREVLGRVSASLG